MAWLAWLLVCAACSGGQEKPHQAAPPTDGDDSGSDETCVDDDGDGFGQHCSLGDDCDDTDPTVTDECRRCVTPSKDCPCKAGTKSISCTPAVVHVAGGTLVCHEGNRYCRDSNWSDCETIGGYVFTPDP